ncbi:Rrf2 family transcriptional regulator [Merdibacter massiliensis]|uniref:Rrf2 family transcriptional regulator n=1 Tax=Merdibacter massiliensis TaxID=1871030 RepID=UPI00096A5C69|nr:Rrf2 family transcriptional regulator [Merdibacter massiliensis]
MQLSMKCSIAVHCLIFIHEAKGIAKVTSSLLAESTGSNPVIIRNTLSALKKAGLIEVKRGSGGACLCKDPKEITLYAIYDALEPHGLSSLIGIHPCEHRACPVAQNIRSVLQKPYQKIEEAIQQTMESITLADMLDDFHTIIQEKVQNKT